MDTEKAYKRLMARGPGFFCPLIKDICRRQCICNREPYISENGLLHGWGCTHPLIGGGEDTMAVLGQILDRLREIEI